MTAAITPPPVFKKHALGAPPVIQNPAVEAHVKERNVPSTVFPQDAPPAVASVLLPEKTKAPRRPAPSPTHRLAVELPDYICREIGKRVVDHNTTKRFVILKALQAAGFTVKDADLYEDGRRGQ